MRILDFKLKGFASPAGNRGQAMLLAVVFFLFISLTIILGITVPVVNHIKNVTISNNSKQSFIIAEALNEDALYRLNHNKNLSSSLSLALNGATASAAVTTSSGAKQIISQGADNHINRSVSTTFTQGQGVAFNYGVQVGQGGFTLMGGSSINGNVYSNGDIVATDGSSITGSAVAADSAALNADQNNNSPSTPPYNISFASSSANQDIAQAFQVSTSSPVNKILFYVKKVSTPSDATVRIVSDNGGSPGTTVIDSGTLSASQVTTSYSWVTVTFSSNAVLFPNTTYWVVIDAASNASKYYVLGANTNTYTIGSLKLGTYGGSWNTVSPSGADGYFTLYLGGVTSTIGGGSYVGAINVGSAGVGDAWAYDVEGGSVAGHLYCQIGHNNNKACDTSRGDPSPVSFPISDGNIQEWKDEADGGGIITGATNCHGGYTGGNCIVDYAGATFGPGKITGNLTVNGGGTLTLTGTVWVQGTITVTGGGAIRLSSSYGSSGGVLLTDGWVDLSGGGQLTGSGSSGSYLLLLTTSQCPNSGSCSGHNAMDVTGGAGAVILNAQNGVMSLAGGVNANEATAYKISAVGGTTVTYQSGLANQNFSSGPSGAWNVSSWQQTL
ncbi:MAG TPA: choice-of-anchor R domain-containing protein [Candidatus Paceibacterota bacterium]|nr:choice-of-anchor R domain-containing protein [Candidatus Paceibacterota bacterium]